jgi:hypothetical protein
MRVLFAGGITKLFNVKVNDDIMAADTIYGTIRRLKLIPLDNMAIISELSANFEVKKITAIKVNNWLKRFA